MLLFLWPTLLKMFKLQDAWGLGVGDVFKKSKQIVNCVLTWISAVINDYPNNNPFGSTWNPFGATTSVSTTSDWLIVPDL